MTGFGFKDRRVAVALKQSLQPGQAISRTVLRHATDGYLLRTPSGGIPARVSNIAGKAECVVYYIGADDHIVTLTDEAGDSVSITVWNIATEEIPGDTEIQAKLIFGKPVCDYEPCDSEGGYGG